MIQSTRTSLVQTFACRLSSAKPLSESILVYWEQISVKFFIKLQQVSIQENAFEDAVCTNVGHFAPASMCLLNKQVAALRDFSRWPIYSELGQSIAQKLQALEYNLFFYVTKPYQCNDTEVMKITWCCLRTYMLPVILFWVRLDLFLAAQRFRCWDRNIPEN